jgi:hypothetical protein
MIRNETELLSLVRILRREYRSQVRFFSTHTLPEYEAVEALDLDEYQRSLFLTFAIVPFHAHPSGEAKHNLGRGGLWKVCANLWQHHRWAFDPVELVEVEGESELDDFFDRLEIMDSYDAHWWFTSAQTILEELNGDPRQLLSTQSYVAPYIERQVRQYDLPGIADDVSTPFWLRLMHDEVHQLDGMRWISFPVDHTIFAVTKSMGNLELSVENREDRADVAAYWNMFCQKHGVTPADIERPLRLLGLYWESEGRDHVQDILTTIRAES